MEGKSLERRISPVGVSLWGWLVAVLLLLLLLILLSASSELLAPLLGHASTAANYLHEFTHDGRHLLGVPCH
jgi:hypothetical protein